MMPFVIAIGVVVVVVLALVGFIAARPADFRVERSAQISAPREVVFAIINDLRQWERWSPYDKRDPNMKKSYEGPSSGPGAIYTWDGNSDVGAGRMTIVESKPGELVAMKLEFFRPFKATNAVNFKLAHSEGGTRVSWIMDGKYIFVTKAMSLFMDFDKMVGKDFEQGLANLNSVAQSESVTAQEGKTTPAATS
jgi:hypothetical protein